MRATLPATIAGLGLLCAAGLATRPAPAVATPQDPELERLVEQIARGDEAQARAAADRLVERVIGPVAAALGSIESRPAAEQRRVRAALARLSAALRTRLFRAGLEPAERELYDEFALLYPELVELAFDDDYRKRLAAVRRIPLEPNTGAGVLVVAKVNDSDGDVAAAALEAAATLKDQVIVRGLTRYVRDATAAVRAGHYGPGEEEAALVVGKFVERSIRILGEAGARASVPDILAALEYFGKSYPDDFFEVAEVAKALGKLGDERAAPPLLEFLGRRRPYRFQYAGQDTRALQTVGDAVLLSLVRIYRLDPASLGFVVAEPPSEFAGFRSNEERQEAHRAFQRWYARNADKPRADRRPPSTRPADKK